MTVLVAAGLRASPEIRFRRTDRSAPAWRDSSGLRRRRPDSETSRAPSATLSGAERRLTSGYCRNWASCARVSRHCEPIFFPFKSPASRLAITSASVTPSSFAASAGLSVSGTPPVGGSRRTVVAAGDAAGLIQHLLRHRHADRHLGADAAGAGRRPSRIPAPSDTSRSRSDCRRRPCWTACRSPARPPAAPTRSRARSVAISMPYFALSTGLINGSSASPSSL